MSWCKHSIRLYFELFCIAFPSHSTPRPVIVEPTEQLDDEDGLPEKLLQKTPGYHKYVWNANVLDGLVITMVPVCSSGTRGVLSFLFLLLFLLLSFPLQKCQVFRGN